MTGRRGRKSEPTALKLAKGTFRADRHGSAELEPGTAIVEVPEPPEALGPDGAAAWRSTLAKILAGGYVTDLDLNAFATYCRTFDEVASCDEQLVDVEPYYLTVSGSLVTHPLVTQRFKWLEVRRRYEAEFWLTPTARAGKQGAPTKKAAGVRTRPRP